MRTWTSTYSRPWVFRRHTAWSRAARSPQRRCRTRLSAWCVTWTAGPRGAGRATSRDGGRLRRIPPAPALPRATPRDLRGLALLLAAVGTYGVISSLVAERRREIGIRMALGADRSRVLAEVMKEGLLLASVGVVVGLGAAFGLKRLVEALLFGVRPTLAGVSATMIVVAAVACLLLRSGRRDSIRMWC
jgi:hypothetical protein